MSSTANMITAVAASWAGTAGGVITVILQKAKKYENEATSYILHVENTFNNILDEVEKVQAQIAALTPAPAPTPAPKPAASKAPAKKAEAAKKRLR